MASSSRPRVFLDIAIGSGAAAARAAHRLTFELFADIVPRTAENFRVLCAGPDGGAGAGAGAGAGRYRNSTLHRIIPGFMAQGGDFTRGDGTGGESIYGPRFEDENFRARHTEAGLLSMANAGPNTNGSQFFITFAATPHLDGKHVVFGRLVEGKEGLRALERVATGANDRPRQPVVVIDCGEIGAGGEEEGPRAGRTGGGAASASAPHPSSQAPAAPPVVIHTVRDLLGAADLRMLPRAMAEEGLPTAFGGASRARGQGARAGGPSTAAAQQHAGDAGVGLAAAAAPPPTHSSSASSSSSSAVTAALPKSAGAGARENVAMEDELAAIIRERVAGKAGAGAGAGSGKGRGGAGAGPASVFGVYGAGGGARSGHGLLGAADAAGSSSDEEDEEEDDDEGKSGAAQQHDDDDDNDDDESGAGAGAGGDPVHDRLFALRMKMAAGRKDNHKEVVLEHKRITDPQAEKRERWANQQAEQVAAERKRAGAAADVDGEAAAGTGDGDGEEDGSGGARPSSSKRARGSGGGGGGGALASLDDLASAAPAASAASRAKATSYLSEPAALAEAKAGSAVDKERRVLLAYGRNAFSEEAMARTHEQRLGRLGAANRDNAAASAAAASGGAGDVVASLAPGQALVGSGAVQSDYVDPAGLDRLLGDFADRDAARAANARKSRSRRGGDGGGPFINEGNRGYNQTVSKAFDKFTVEIKQNLERGTAT
jgi:cyclophilin family peptidyl-prolyl cis-trans isomerase